MSNPLGPVPPHYIKHNALSRYPREWVALSVAGKFSGENTITWRYASALFTRLGKTAADPVQTEHLVYDSSAVLWCDVASAAKKAGKLIVVSMTLADDIRLSAGIPWLVSNGWIMDRLNVRDDAFSGQFHLGKAKIIFVDLLSWLPGTISTIARLTDITCKPALQWSASDSEWYQETVSRMLATDAAWFDLITWIRDDDLGNWKPTGAGMAWAEWRHRHYSDKVLMHGRPALMEVERLAAGTGRAEAWRHGTLVGDELTDWDMTLAYPAIALETEIPIAYSGEMRGASLRLVTNPPQGKRFLIEATVTQSLPVLGVNVNDGWIWPVGTIHGVWWDCELKAAVEAGSSVDVKRVWYYKAAYALADWAEWLFEYLYGSAPGATPVRKAAAKHFGRGLIGRFGVRYDTWIKDGAAPRPGYYSSTLADYDTGATTPAMVLGDVLYLSSGKQWGHDAIPQVMSAIMAECRVRLWRLMQIAGLSHVIYVDTDSLITDQHGTAALEAHLSQIPTWGLRPKHIYETVEIFGPRQLISQANSKISGIPKTATRRAEKVFTGTVVDGMAGSMFRGGLDAIMFDAREWVLGTQDKRRRHLDGGLTVPYEAQTTEAGTFIP